MSKIKNSGLHQYDAEPFEQQQFGTAGIEGVNIGDVLTTQVKVQLQIRVISFYEQR